MRRRFPTSAHATRGVITQKEMNFNLVRPKQFLGVKTEFLVNFEPKLK